MNRATAALLTGALLATSESAAAQTASQSGVATVATGRGTVAARAPQEVPTVESGFKQLEAGDSLRAESIFQHILAADPRSVGACEGLVWTYMKAGRTGDAAFWADKRLALTPNDQAWQVKRLSILSQVPSRRNDAIAGYRDWVTAHPSELPARLQLAQLLSWTPGKLPEAIREYRAAVALSDRDRGARLGLAQALAWNGQSRESEPIYDSLLSENPTDADALLGRAQVARWSGDRATALRLISRGRTAYPADGRFPAEAARIALDNGRPGPALSEARKAMAVSPDLPDARQVLSLAQQATEPRVGVRISGSDESTGFRRDSIGLPLELRPFAQTRLRIEPAYERDQDDFDQLARPNLGIAVLQDLSQTVYVNGEYRAYLPQGAGTTQALGGELGVKPSSLPLELRIGARRRALVDVPAGYEDIAYLTGVGSGGTTIAGIREHLQTNERYVGLSVTPRAGIYIYGNGTRGDLSDDNRSRSVAAGLGIDVFAISGVLPKQSLTFKYDYFYLDYDQVSTRYFSPANFQVHTPGLDWRYHVAGNLLLGLEAGLPMRVGGSTGYIAGSFFRWQESPTVAIEGRARVVDDTQYRIVSFTVGPRIVF